MSTNISSLDSSIQTAVLWLKEIQEEMQLPDKEKVYRATKAVLQTIRDRLPFEEVVHFSANLPLIMKGMMFDNYTLEDKPLKIKTIEEVFTCVQAYYMPQGDFISSDDALRGVVNVLVRKIGPEMQKVADNMPEKIRPLFQTRTAEQGAKPSRKRTSKRILRIPPATQ